MRKTLLSMVTVVGFLAASTSPAAAVDFGIFGSYWDSDEVGGAFGLGYRVWVDINDNLDFEVSTQWVDKFERNLGVLVPTPLTGFQTRAKLRAVPVDLGLAHSFGDDGRGLVIGAGGTWASMSGQIVIADPSLPGGFTEFGSVDDEFGWYAKLGFEADGLFIDLLYRDLTPSVEGLSTATFAGIPSNILDLTGFQAILGWRF